MFLQRRLAVPFAVLALLTGCASDRHSRPESAASAGANAVMAQAADMGKAAEAPAAEGAGQTLPAAILPRKIIYTADVEMTTTAFRETAARIQQAVRATGGYVAETSTGATPEALQSGTWKVRIPVARFDRFLADLGSLGTVARTGISSQDVSEEFYDVQARLKNKRIEEERLVSLLRTATGKLQEVLAVEKEISRVRGEIEQMEGRIRFLANQTDLTTVTITLRELAALENIAAPSFPARLQQTLVGSVVALTDLVKSGIVGLVAVLPWAVVFGGVVLPLSYAVRRFSRRPPPPRSDGKDKWG